MRREYSETRFVNSRLDMGLYCGEIPLPEYMLMHFNMHTVFSLAIFFGICDVCV